MAAAAILAHRMTPGQTDGTKAVSPMDSSPTSSSGTSSSNSAADSATISANDFLTLLVTEMQNQDPTSDTDPNEYVDQLVQVNSLEQLISINQTLTTSLDPSGSTSSDTDATSSGGTAASPISENAQAGATSPVALHKTGAAAQPLQAPGNLSIPAANPAAEQVGHALDHSQNQAGSHAPAQHLRPKVILGRFPTAI